ncbi:MAG: C4-dicarboxylate transporter DctM subunit [Paracoccaceae bacterium]|jgi:C4-dicarboxylate transporter DctM subunit
MPTLFAGTLGVLIVLGVPIFITLLLPVVIFLVVFTDTPALLVIQRLFSGIDKFPLMAIPFFILAGNIMAQGGLSKRLIRLANAFVSPFSGGLAMTAVASSMFFAAISGSSPATVIAVGKVMMPAMAKQGYPRSFTIGLLMSAGSLGIIIPPSIFMIVYGAVTGVSIGALFLAGIGAGLIYGIVFLIVCFGYARIHGIKRSAQWDKAEMLAAGRDSLWGLAAPLIILGGIYGGLFTPTEAAAVAVVYATLVTMVIYREMSLRELLQCTVQSAITTAQVMIIIAAASAFAWYLTTSGFANGISGLLSGFSDDPVKLLLAINVIVIIAGMVLDPNSIIIILVPFIAVVATQAGIDPIHLGIVLSVNAAIGMFTPPFGLNLFVATGLGATYREAITGSAPFITAALVALMLITYVPAISLWLPSLVY